jgi:hypothetical protein
MTKNSRTSKKISKKGSVGVRKSKKNSIQGGAKQKAVPKKNVYCGVNKLSKTQVRGSMDDCARKGQIRYYGLKKVDSKIAVHYDKVKEQKKEQQKNKEKEKKKIEKDANGGKIYISRTQAMLKIVGLKTKINKMKRRLGEVKMTEKEKTKIEKEIATLSKSLEQYQKKYYEYEDKKKSKNQKIK